MRPVGSIFLLSVDGTHCGPCRRHPSASPVCFVHTSVVKTSHLSLCCLTLIPKQVWPLASTRCFLFFGPFSVRPRDGRAWKSQLNGSFWKCSNSCDSCFLLVIKHNFKELVSRCLLIGWREGKKNHIWSETTTDALFGIILSVVRVFIYQCKTSR